MNSSVKPSQSYRHSRSRNGNRRSSSARRRAISSSLSCAGQPIKVERPGRINAKLTGLLSDREAAGRIRLPGPVGHCRGIVAEPLFALAQCSQCVGRTARVGSNP